MRCTFSAKLLCAMFINYMQNWAKSCLCQNKINILPFHRHLCNAKKIRLFFLLHPHVAHSRILNINSSKWLSLSEIFSFCSVFNCITLHVAGILHANDEFAECTVCDVFVVFVVLAHKIDLMPPFFRFNFCTFCFCSWFCRKKQTSIEIELLLWLLSFIIIFFFFWWKKNVQSSNTCML